MTAISFADAVLSLEAAWLGGPVVLGAAAGRWAGLLLAATTGLLAGWLVGWPLRLLLKRAKSRVPGVTWADGFEHGLTAPVWLLVTTTTVLVSVDALGFPDPPATVLRRACGVVLAATASLLGVRLLAAGREYLRVSLVRGVTDPSRVRSIETRVTVPVGILQFLTWVAGVALVCLQFQAVQNVGVSILASAGVAGVVLGLAAQKTVANILAGMQLALASQIRIGDTVVAEGEFGVVEEIGLTYVTLAVWDRHRLVLPVSYFVDKPFQNWTKGSPEVRGVVLLYTDFTVPVKDVRAEFERILVGTDLFDGRKKALDVTSLTADKVELRAVVSAADSGRLWELQCLVREELLGWLQSRGREYIPIRRVGTVAGRAAEAG